MILAFAIAASIASGTCASHARPERGGRFAKPSMKGVELYSWRAEDASPRFSLHWGTNRTKSEAEVKAAECTLGSVEALEHALTRFPEGEQVMWRREAHGIGGLAFPAETVVSRVLAHARALRITMGISPPAVPERRQPVPSHDQPAPGRVPGSLPCRAREGTQREMNACAARDAEAADERLRSVMAELGRSLEPAPLQQLGDLHRRWISLRDAECRWESGLAGHGSVAAMVFSDCITTHTRQRIEWLSPLLCEGFGVTGPCAASERYGR